MIVKANIIQKKVVFFLCASDNVCKPQGWMSNEVDGEARGMCQYGKKKKGGGGCEGVL